MSRKLLTLAVAAITCLATVAPPAAADPIVVPDNMHWVGPTPNSAG